MPIALALRSVSIVAMVPLLAYVFGRGTVGSLVIISRSSCRSRRWSS